MVVDAVPLADRLVYGQAYVDALRWVFLGAGILGVVGGVIAWVALGRRDPLATVYEFGEERQAEPSA